VTTNTTANAAAGGDTAAADPEATPAASGAAQDAGAASDEYLDDDDDFESEGSGDGLGDMADVASINSSQLSLDLTTPEKRVRATGKGAAAAKAAKAAETPVHVGGSPAAETGGEEAAAGGGQRFGAGHNGMIVMLRHDLIIYIYKYLNFFLTIFFFFLHSPLLDHGGALDDSAVRALLADPCIAALSTASDGGAPLSSAFLSDGTVAIGTTTGAVLGFARASRGSFCARAAELVPGGGGDSSNSVTSLCAVLGDQFLVVGRADGSLTLFGRSGDGSGTATPWSQIGHPLREHKGAVRAVAAWAPAAAAAARHGRDAQDGITNADDAAHADHTLSGAEDGTVLVCRVDPDDGISVVDRLIGHAAAVSCVAVPHDRRPAAEQRTWCLARLTHTKKKKRFASSFYIHFRKIFPFTFLYFLQKSIHLQIHPGFVTGSVDGLALSWSVKSGHPVATFRDHTGPITGVALLPDGKRVATCSHDKTVRIWDPNTAAEIDCIAGLVKATSMAPLFLEPQDDEGALLVATGATAETCTDTQFFFKNIFISLQSAHLCWRLPPATARR
jgi:WD40 repeat protein